MAEAGHGPPRGPPNKSNEDDAAKKAAEKSAEKAARAKTKAEKEAKAYKSSRRKRDHDEHAERVAQAERERVLYSEAMRELFEPRPSASSRTPRQQPERAGPDDELLRGLMDLSLEEPSAPPVPSRLSASPVPSRLSVSPVPSRLSAPSAPFESIAATAASQTPATLPMDHALTYPIVKLVAISVTHGSSIGERGCQALPYATHDFRKVFFFGNDEENICFDDPRFGPLFASKNKPFKPNEGTIRLLLGMDRPKCRYEDPNVYLPPVVFTLEPSDTQLLHEHNRRRKHLMGLYLYVIRRNPADQKLFIQKLKVASYDELDSEIYLTYSIIFGRFHNFIKANAELLSFMRRSMNPNPLTVGFFCCRGAHLRHLYNPFIMASIQTPHTCLPPLPTILFVDNPVIFARYIPHPRLFLRTMLPADTIEFLHSTVMGGQPLLRRGMRNVTWQSCLYNLFVFFNVISRESADALASVASSQQIRQLSTDAILVSGESTQEAIRILNGLIPANIQRGFVVQRLPISLGIYKIISVLRNIAFRNTYVVFAKVYPKEYVPTAPNIPSQMGHWIAIARFGDLRMYYVDVQTDQYTLIPPLTPSNEAFIYSELLRLFAPYVVMDLLYVSTPAEPYFPGPDVLNLQLPQVQPQVQPPSQPQAPSQSPPPPPPSSDSDGGGMRRQRYIMSKKRKFKSKMKTRTKKIA